MKGQILDKGGFIAFKTLFWVLFFAFAIYGAYKYVPPYFSYYMLKTDVEDEAKNAHMYTDEALQKRIIQKAEIWSVPLTNDNIIIDRNSTIKITVFYTETINFLDRYRQDIKYRIEVEKPLKGKLDY